MKKTLFITIYDGAVAKNLLHTKVVDQLKAVFCVVLFVSKNRADVYRTTYPDLVVEVAPKPQHPKLERLFSRLVSYSLHTESILLKIRFGRTIGDSFPTFVLKLLLWYLGSWSVFRTLLRALYRVIPNDSFDRFFVDYKPDLVFGGSMNSDQDAQIFKTARRFRVPAVGMPKSWDNLTTKTLFSVLPNKLFVQSTLMKREAVQYMDLNDKNVEVVGTAQFDIYANRERVPSRAAFCATLGLDPDKKIVLYAAAGNQLAPHDEEVLSDLVRAFREKKFEDAQILVRPHPKYKFKDHLFTQISFLIVDYPGGRLGVENQEWEFNQDDVTHLVCSLLYADVVVNTASTLIIEAAIFDKPIVAIDYDGHHTLPEALRVGRHYHFSHLKPIMEVGGLQAVCTNEELVDAVRTYLDTPTCDQEGRKKIVDLEVSHFGHAAERLATAITRYSASC